MAQLEQQYAGESEKLEELKRKAQELNQVNLESINQQFKDLGMTIRENALGEFQNFFNELVKDNIYSRSVFSRFLCSKKAFLIQRRVFSTVFDLP